MMLKCLTLKNLMAGVFAVAAVGHCGAYTTVESVAGEASGHSKLTEANDGSKDLWKGGAPANDPNYDYIALHQTRTPATGSGTTLFNGHSFQVGNANTAATLAQKVFGSKVVWQNEGLFLRNGDWQAWDQGTVANPLTFAGTITVTSPKSKPFGIFPTPDANQFGKYCFCIDGDFRSAANTSIYVKNNDYKGKTNDCYLAITAATTNFFGELIVKSNAYVTVSGSAFPGAITVEDCARLTLTNGCHAIGKVAMAQKASVTVYLAYSETDGLLPLVISNEVERADGAPAIRVVVPAGNLTSVGSSVTLVKTVGEGKVHLADYVFEGLEALPYYYKSFSAPTLSDDEKSIVLTASDYVQMRKADVSGYTSLSNQVNAARQTPTNWTDNLLPHAGASYMSIGKTLRTSPDYKGFDTFPGDRLVFMNGGGLALKSEGLVCDDMIFYGSGIYAYGAPTNQSVRGKITVYHSRPGYDNWTVMRSQNGRELSIAADIAGPGGNDRSVIAISSDGDSQVASPVSFTGDNRNFYGRIEVAGTNEKRYPVRVVNRVESMGGGSTAISDGNGITVKKWGKLRVDESIDFDIPGRYLYIWATGRVGVAENKLLRVASRMKIEGNLWKEDPGTLELACEMGFGNSNSAAPKDGTNNFIEVRAGSLKVTHKRGVDGARITLSQGARMLVDLHPTDEMANRGIINTRTACPFQPATDGGKVEFAFDTDATKVTESITVPLCTVKTAAAEALGAAIRLVRPKGLKATLLAPRDNGDGTTTFLAELRPSGLVMFVQ